MKNKFVKGQRWLSDSEPELGLGLIIDVNLREVQVHFPSQEFTRCYSVETAPLRRLRFTVGDTVISTDGRDLMVDKILDEDGVLVYCGGDAVISETELAETMDFSAPEDRILIGKTDPNHLFDLRYAALRRRHWLQSLKLRGFLGGRISLLPHQLYIVSEVTRRYHIRVILGDEVGLGKTIEAGLILHRQLLTGACARVLILLPESLAHQWFLELWRRFNIVFSVFDEERCEAIESTQSDSNPFADSSRIICDFKFLRDNPARMLQVCAEQWDMLIVDEAHNLSWTPESASTGYQLVERLSQRIPSVLLLSGTPEQLGETGHFARLKLLDQNRFHNLEDFSKDQSRYVSVAGIVEKLIDGELLNDDDQRLVSEIYGYDQQRLRTKLREVENGDSRSRDLLIADLVDRHGTGRLFYRNQRRNIRGFPKRVPLLHNLSMDEACAALLRGAQFAENDLCPECQVSRDSVAVWWKNDPRVDYVIKLLVDNPDDKVLLICARRETVQALQAEIEQKIKIPIALFYEDLPLLVRDRNAAYFAEHDGARLLICSEIGSEGRNFQFCHRLVLFDLPINPELLEQRIGRLDRIGQKNDVHIHVPYIMGTSMEVLATWYDDGLNAFRKPVSGASILYRDLKNRVLGVTGAWRTMKNSEALRLLIKDTQEARKIVDRQLASGRDRLLEYHSCRPEIGKAIVNEIEDHDSRPDLAIFMEDVCQHLGVQVEDHDYDGLFFRQGAHYQGLPGLPDDGLAVTFSRTRALAREDLAFLTWEHPMVIGAIDELIGSSSGRVGYAFWADPESRTILLETIFLVYSMAPMSLRPDRFLPPTPLRILINHSGKDLSDDIGSDLLTRVLKDEPQASMLQKPEVTQDLIPALTERCRQLAETKKHKIMTSAIASMTSALNTEIERLNSLQAANAPVCEEEINILEDERKRLNTHFSESVVRLDSIRFIWRGSNGG